MEGFCHKSEQITRRRNPIRKATDGNAAPTDILPRTQKSYDPVPFESSIENLREEVHVGDKGSLKDHTNIGSIEEPDRVSIFISSIFFVGEFELNFESLKVYDK